MGWERRERGGSYYVRKVRRGGHVCSEYLGNGETASLIAQMEALERMDKQIAQENERDAREQFAEAERQNAAFFAEVESALRQALEAAGYHQPKRGQWRKQRERHTENQ